MVVIDKAKDRAGLALKLACSACNVDHCRAHMSTIGSQGRPLSEPRHAFTAV